MRCERGFPQVLSSALSFSDGSSSGNASPTLLAASNVFGGSGAMSRTAADGHARVCMNRNPSWWQSSSLCNGLIFQALNRSPGGVDCKYVEKCARCVTDLPARGTRARDAPELSKHGWNMFKELDAPQDLPMQRCPVETSSPCAITSPTSSMFSYTLPGAVSASNSPVANTHRAVRQAPGRNNLSPPGAISLSRTSSPSYEVD